MNKTCNKNLIFSIFLLVSIFVFLLSISGCSSVRMLLDNFKLSESTTSDVIKINLDENELKSLEITNQTIEEKIDTISDVIISSEELRDPFMPFFLTSKGESENQKNMLTVERIYSEGDPSVYFVEINFNSAVYKLETEDLFGKIYQVKAINADSVVLLKGDEIITLFINEIYYD